MKIDNIYHTLDVANSEAELATNISNGISEKEAETRLKQVGSNHILEAQKNNPFRVLLKQFLNPMTYLLLLASGLSFVFQEWLDGFAILIVILANVLIGFWMEWQAERSMNALKKMVSTTAKVIRDKKVNEVSSENIVPGDLLLLDAGDMVTADARLIENVQLQTNESALTGESLPVEKNIGILPKETPLAERKNMLYKGTFVSNGNGKAIVVATGMNTELGDIAKLVQTSSQSATPLEKKLTVFSKKLIIITIILVVLIFFAGLLNGAHWLEMLKTAIALAVAAIPEGLPIVATLALAQGMMRMAKHQVIVKKLSAVETLGGTTVICSDKTGTLTQNKIEVSVLDLPGNRAEVKNITNGKPIAYEAGSTIENDKNYPRLLKIAALCNTAEYSFSNQIEVAIGDPLETGLLRFVLHNEIDIQGLRKDHLKVDEIPFNSNDKVMATKHLNNGNYWVAAKGAVEELVNNCTFIDLDNHQTKFDETQKTQWLERANQLAKKGLRVLAFAWKDCNKDEVLMNNLIFAGIIGFLDPPANGVKQAIKECKKAGINVVMITGDHPATALTIANKLGIVEDEDSDVILGKEMPSYEHLTDETKRSWMDAYVFARVSPAQKLDLIRVLQENKNIVGMTGDGVNDAPALKKSDIGIAMGIRGTQVAQEAADMILKDDSFASIVSAIKQGRIIFDNIRKFVIYLLSCNLSELLLVATIALFNLPFQLFPLQILFINLVTDIFPALALGVGRGNKLVMQNKPRHTDEPIISKRQWKSIWVYAFVIALFTLGAVMFSHYILHKTDAWNSILNNNIIFFTLVVAQMFHVFNMTSANVTFHKSEVVRNKFVWYALGLCAFILLMAFEITPVAEVLQLTSIRIADWIVIIASAAAATVFTLILKKIKIIE